MNQRTLLIPVLLGLLLAAPAAQAQVQQPGMPASAARVLELARVATAPLPAEAAAARSNAGNVQLTEMLIEMDDFLEWLPAAKSVYTYTDGRRVFEEQFYMGDDGAWHESARALFDNSRPMRLLDEIQTWDAGEGAYVPEKRFLWFIFYNWLSGVPHISEMVEQEWEDGAWVNLIRTTYSYVLCGTGTCPLNASTESVWTDGEWARTFRHVWTSNDGEGAALTRTEPDGDSWVNVERYLFHPLSMAEAQQRFSEILEKTEDTGTLLLYMRAPDYLHQEWDGASWKDATRQWSWYLENGYELVMERYKSNGTGSFAWVETGHVVVEYEGPGRPAHLIAEDTEDEEALGLYEYYTWDPAGRLAGATQGFLVVGNEIPFLRYGFTWSDVSTGTERPHETASFTLDPAYPNPFASTTTIPYRTAASGTVSAKVYDATGRQVATLFDGYQTAGTHGLTLDAASLAAGVYFVRMESGGTVQSRMLILQR
jgi:hypothetical protein